MLIRNFSQRLKRLEQTPRDHLIQPPDFRRVSPKQFPADGKLYLWPSKGGSPTSLGNTTLCLDLLYYVIGYEQNAEKETALSYNVRYY